MWYSFLALGKAKVSVMAIDPVEQLHADLGFAAVAPQLRAVSGVWDKLEKLQAKARASRSGFAAYKQFLERCVRQIQADEDLTSEQTVAACDEYMKHVIALIAEHDINEIENRRGIGKPGSTLISSATRWVASSDRLIAGRGAGLVTCPSRQTNSS
jgi:hypothetical protein